MKYLLVIKYKSGGEFIFPNRNGLPLREVFQEIEERALDNTLRHNVVSWSIQPVEDNN